MKDLEDLETLQKLSDTISWSVQAKVGGVKEAGAIASYLEVLAQS